MTDDLYELVLSAPGRNALSTDHMQRILAALREAGGRPLLLRGDEGAFSAGLNLKEVASLDVPAMSRFLRLLDALMDGLYNYAGPSVACVEGHAIAGGCVLALCCDWRVAAARPALRIGLNEVAIGLEFPPKILALARDRVPRRALERVLLEGGLHDPQTACELGLVDEVADDPATSARAALARLAAVPRQTYVATKRALRDGVLALSAAQERQFEEQIVPAWCAPETKALITRQLKR
ncbi:MAG: enoyl-CoA hydratase/isomerase family protein [Deltaproteobacteria bacterium]|nr:enoyl-CoA hydratase/isomerase family protein [Deltaproteobacteria bacterium]